MGNKRREIHGTAEDYVLHQYGDEWEVYNMDGHFICYVKFDYNDTDELLERKIRHALEYTEKRCAAE